MSERGGPLPEGQVRVNLATQVAGIAAQVSVALHSGDPEKKRELAGKLVRARDLLEAGTAPEGLVPFIDVMRGLLLDTDVSSLVDELELPYRAVYDQLISDLQEPPEEGGLTLREVLDEVTHHVVTAMRQGSYGQRRMMANTLLQMERESERRPDLGELIDFLEAARALLQDEDPGAYAVRLHGPFQAHWEEILNQTRQ